MKVSIFLRAARLTHVRVGRSVDTARVPTPDALLTAAFNSLFIRALELMCLLKDR